MREELKIKNEIISNLQKELVSEYSKAMFVAQY